ncbi:1-(5-phosphoribosyl)-5-[(5-phosphoribosylamino)methylideneamino]imidazole-4-carboxamide isomerase [Rikenella microfusus]|uniref:1-(5-phosphoribosyl)-5-[(5- phosphoribosylamino)methylideneamino]imidazole-4- carboxamide isomerase n=1 Tax=Rikenella microfusus TaxID=28139 RepID=UPI001DDBA233|nr:1-(5-phosphoribosyl)-5-[(5-phosphoribosylamino)methylideneamino]imidazole-4-carboxamide isomerase [Rikenella microfusus]HJE88300.1 1-(5-phosphoribosyl)-5-[(5-phosphoribosylamino)methylideneamino]imidazole-4-carboxamide isomerase [Rikenella microfusus]
MNIEIIPAIDIIGGQCVRLTQGDYGRKTTYGADPVEIARNYEAIGIRRLHVVDLDGAKAAAPQNLGTLRKIASATGLDIQYGGGIKSGEALRAVLEAGANRAICGSIAVTDPERFEEWLAAYGPEHIVLGADTKAGKVAINGWTESSETDVQTVIRRFAARGLRQTICTDISRDGMLAGPNFDLYATLQEEFPQVEITVSGGIASSDDIVRLDGMGLRNVIVGKAIYEGRITLKDLEQCLRNG